MLLVVGLVAFAGFLACIDARSTERNDMPHHAIMRLVGKLGYFGGSLIHPNWIITAASPIVEPGTPLVEIETYYKYNLEAAMGNVDFGVQGFPQQWSKADFVTVSTSYGRTHFLTYTGDVALVHLHGLVDVTTSVYPVRLPWNEDLLPKDTEYAVNEVDFLVAGTDQGKDTATLRVFDTRMKMLPISACEPRKVGLFPGSSLCLQSTEIDGTPCAADVGSGIIGDPQCNGRNVILGIVSQPMKRLPDGTCDLQTPNTVTLLDPFINTFVYNYINKSNIFFATRGLGPNEACWTEWCAEKVWCPATLPSILNARHRDKR